MYDFVQCSHDRREKKVPPTTVIELRRLSSLSIHFPSRHFRHFVRALSHLVPPGLIFYHLYKRTHQRNLNPMNEEQYPFDENRSIFGVFERRYQAWGVDAFFFAAIKFHHSRSFSLGTSNDGDFIKHRSDIPSPHLLWLDF